MERRHLRPSRTRMLHGAWADGSSWAGVVRGLQHDGCRTVPFANPVRVIERAVRSTHH
ncbi:hypothetical protein SAMN04487968_1113 [Nocardioides terrae]|uniref:Uncharacterized protein n=1 Tax=Nocardioides terrae TaxID=574651 RepID=A0A1I1LUK5_9ACTN|nr:hypothetical protein [Nocardioides terrae]SFC76162.1 hypothetical protein SAMN04487968_1113 [Nocardioides terrae]